VGRDSVVGILAPYGLDGPGIEARRGEVVIFSAPVLSGPETHPASSTVGTVSVSQEKNGGAWR
jgi:hypothetical protein